MPDHVNIVVWQVFEAVIENGITKKKHILIRVSTEMQDSIVIELMLLTSLLNFSELLAYVIEFHVNTSNYLIVGGCYMSEIYFTSRQATVTSVTPSKYHNRDLSEVSVEFVEVQNWLQGPFGFKSGNRSNSGGDPHWKLWTERPEYNFSMFMHIKYKTFLIFYQVTLNLIMYSSSNKSTNL